MNSLRLHYYLTDFITGIILLCLPIYFKLSMGLDAFEIGIIFFVGGMGAVICALVGSLFAQKIKNKKRILNVGLIFLILGVFYLNILSLRPSIDFIQVLISSVFIFMMRSIIYILADDIATTYAEQTPGVEYGKMRSFGSIGWGSNFLVNGIILVFFPRLFLPFFLILAVIIWINSFYLPTSKSQNHEEFRLKDVTKILSYKNYILFLTVSTIMWMNINNMNMFVEYIIVDNGGSLIIYFLLSIIFIVADVSIIHFSGLILKRIKSKRYIFTYLNLILFKFLLIILFPYPPVIYITILLDPVIFGMLIPFNSIFIKREVPSNLSTIAFMMSASLAIVFVSIVSPIYGYIYDVAGPRILFGVMFLLMIIALLIASKIDFKQLDKKQK